MIITSDNLSQNIDKKIKYFSDKTYILSIINTEGNFGAVCYLNQHLTQADSGTNNREALQTWQPFCYDYGVKKFKFKAKTYRELINNIPPLDRNNIADIKGKFYNTFDTPVEVSNNIFATTFEIINNAKHNILERKTYYLITDVQELERTFDPSIMPCEIINFDNFNDLYKDIQVDESLKYLIQHISKKTEM